MSHDDDKPKFGGRSLRMIVERARQQAESQTFYTIQLGAGRDVPLHEGGTGPDEPVWYFDRKEQFDLAVAKAAELGVTITTDTAERLPDDDVISDADEFGEYAKMQVNAGDQP